MTMVFFYYIFQGKKGTLLMSLTASSATITDVSLVDPFGSGEVNGRVETRDGGEYLVHFDTIPLEDFVVCVKGKAASSTVAFQRQSSTTLKSSNLTVRVSSSPTPKLILLILTNSHDQ